MKEITFKIEYFEVGQIKNTNNNILDKYLTANSIIDMNYLAINQNNILLDFLVKILWRKQYLVFE